MEILSGTALFFQFIRMLINAEKETDMCTVTTRILDNFGIKYFFKQHQNAVFNCEDVARERGVMLSQVLKCMVGEDSNGTIYIMLFPGDKMLNIKKYGV